MKWRKNHDRSDGSFSPRLRVGLVFTALVFLAALLVTAQQVGEPKTSTSTTAPAPMLGQSAPAQAQNQYPAEAQRKKQIADESARLLAMAADLKAEVDKTTKDTLSIPVVRKAGEIEKLARSVKDRNRLDSEVH
jgi:hypothetical protein